MNKGLLIENGSLHVCNIRGQISVTSIFCVYRNFMVCVALYMYTVKVSTQYCGHEQASCTLLDFRLRLIWLCIIMIRSMWRGLCDPLDGGRRKTCHQHWASLSR